MLDQLNKIPDLKIKFKRGEDIDLTREKIASIKDFRNTEIITQSHILGGIMDTFYDIPGIKSKWGINSISNAGIEDGTIPVFISPEGYRELGLKDSIEDARRILIGAEVKRYTYNLSSYKKEEALCSMLSQEVDYQRNREGPCLTSYDIILAVCNQFIGICYVLDNEEAYYELCDFIDEHPTMGSKKITGSNIWEKCKKDIYPICRKFKWRHIIPIDFDFRYENIVVKMLTDIINLKQWKQVLISYLLANQQE